MLQVFDLLTGAGLAWFLARGWKRTAAVAAVLIVGSAFAAR